MTNSLAALMEDLGAEQCALDDVVATNAEAQWRHSTPSPGWDVADQIAHLTYFDEAAAVAILDPVRFRSDRDELFARALEGCLDQFTLSPLRSLSPAELLERWREARRALAVAASTLSPEARVEWYGPSMSTTSFLSARLMETWAHGTDVVDALGASRPATDRLVHVARLGYLTRRWSYQVRSETVPEGDLRLELTSPSGTVWTWGPEDADDTVRGSAEEFCLVVTQRRHFDDTSLEAGELGAHWLVRAQAFAGVATSGPERRAS
ncbi:MAG: TIGR03084 family metal-binding protein [Acidimicrobiales bacterium]